MPDSIGRYQFSEMARSIRDRLVAITKTVDPTTGEETSTTITNQLISNTDILAKLNSAQAGLYLDAIRLRPELFEADSPIDVGQFQNQYSFPLNMISLSALMWLRPNITPPSVTTSGPIPLEPTDYVEMVCIDDPHDFNDQRSRYTAPTWRRVGSGFQLNEIPQVPTPGGMIVRGIFLPSPLMDDLASPPPPLWKTYVQGPLPTVAQELMMLTATKKLALEKMQQEAGSLDEELGHWRLRWDVAIDNIQRPRSVQFTSGSLIQATYSGKRRSGWRWRG